MKKIQHSDSCYAYKGYRCTCPRVAVAPKTYRIVEFDANEVPRVFKTGYSRNEARAALAVLRGWAKEKQIAYRYIMKRDTPEPAYDPQVGNALWTGEKTELQPRPQPQIISRTKKESI